MEIEGSPATPWAGSTELRIGVVASVGLATQRTVEELLLLISCGEEMNRYRDRAVDVLARYTQMIRFERQGRFVMSQWDYRRDASRDETPGQLAARSLDAVEQSEGVIAILGPTVPEITRKEIRRVYDLRRSGRYRHLWCFGAPGEERSGADRMSRSDFIFEIERDFEALRVYHSIVDETDFVASLIFEMMPWVVARCGPAFGPISGTGMR